VKYAWIEQHRDSYPVTMMCELLEVSRSGLHAARTRPASARARAEAQLVDEIRRAQRRHRGRYGRRRMSRELNRAVDRAVNEKRVGRLMREHDLQSRLRRRFRIVTTDSKHAHPVAPNVLARDFEATAPNQKWLADLTYVPTAEGWLYLALILDLFSRKFVGWAMSDSMPQELTLAALQMALGWRDPPAGLTHHSDRGSAVRRRRLSQGAGRPRHHRVDEPQGRLLGQCADGIGQRHGEGRVRARRRIQDSRRGRPGDR
jgi:putative transposase